MADRTLRRPPRWWAAGHRAAPLGTRTTPLDVIIAIKPVRVTHVRMRARAERGDGEMETEIVAGDGVSSMTYTEARALSPSHTAGTACQPC